MAGRLNRAAAALAAAGLALTASAAERNINAAASSLVATFRQQHVPVDAPFRRFSGTISYDATRPEATSATLAVDVDSLDLGDADASAELRKPAWFDYARYPRASFQSTAARHGAAGQLEISGTLTIKGRSQPVTVTVQPGAAPGAFDGSFEISRKAFGIGDPAWDGVLDDQVRVRFHIVAAVAATP